MEAILNAINVFAIIVDLVIISMIVSNSFWGYRKGLTAVIFKILASIASLILVFILYKPVASIIIEKTQIDEKLSIAIENNISGLPLGENSEIKIEHSLISDNILDIMNSYANDALEQAENNAIKYVAVKLSHLMIRVATLIVLYMVIRFLLMFVRFAVELIANLPIISMVNKSGGLIYGVLKGFLIAYLILAVFSLISPLISDLGIISAIEDSFIGSKMYNNNIILNLFK